MTSFTDSLDLWGLFASSFISSTLLPGGSEVVLGYLVNTAAYPVWLLLLVATLGNGLGGSVTFALGWWIVNPFKADSKKHQRAMKYVQRYGAWSLLLSWVPVIGDPLCLLAGWLKLPVLLSVVLIFLGKLARYWVVFWVVS